MPVGQMPLLRLKLANLPEFMRDIKVTFARYYNRRHSRRGYFWGDRFKSVIVDRGETLSKAFVSTHYQRFKHLFAAKKKKLPKPVKGLSGMYSLKQLSEIL